jgi:hypothetical protein
MARQRGPRRGRRVRVALPVRWGQGALDLRILTRATPAITPFTQALPGALPVMSTGTQ